MSNVLAGFVVKSAGYNLGFLILAVITVVALAFGSVYLKQKQESIEKHHIKPLQAVISY
ncbi:hypothetical protein [Nostoc sp. LPT]|uniref:hypothetical protein n=1 Tax=Nostoc sp. LPT TaxID=2815387 RepID=UPI001D61CF71|nr:hypothetical protein [Nostoc sp. LPT]MBN4006121.1 hypothetical protein [Nostoc sp. LPT]